MVEFVYENPIGLNLKLILSTNHCATKMLYYISYQYKLLPSKFPIGKRQNNFQCKRALFHFKENKIFSMTDMYKLQSSQYEERGEKKVTHG